MGTSSSYAGPGAGSPLIPPWHNNNEAEELDAAPPEDESEKPAPRQVAPTVRLIPARRWLRQYAAGAGVDALGRSLGHYVRGMGGASGAARSAPAGRMATRRLGAFLSDVAAEGVEAAIRGLGLTQIIGSPAEEVLAAIADTLAPRGASLEESIARNAMSATLWDLYVLYSLDDGEISRLNGMDTQDVRTALKLWVSNYVYERFLHVMLGTLRGEVTTEDALIAIEREIKSFIRETVALELDATDVLSASWGEPQGDRIAERTLLQAYTVWEAMVL